MRIAIFLIILSTVFTGYVSALNKKELREKYEGKTFYLQHNLWHQNGSVSWVNFIGVGDYLPIGTKVEITDVNKEEMVFKAEGYDEKYEFDLEDARPSYEEVVDRVFGDSKPSMEGLSESDREGIKAGKVKEGMTRQGVFKAVGYPPYSYTPPFKRTGAINHDPNEDELDYMKSRFDMVIYKFEDDKLVEITD